MALIDILRLIASKDGIQIDDAEQKQLAIARVNEAAAELYESEDFPESLKEEVFDLNVDSQMVALPWYVEHIRGWRYFESRYSGEVADKRNRYRDGRGNELWMHRWRNVEYYPLMHKFENESVLKLTIPKPETVAFTVTIVGATSNSAKISEVITFAVGDTEKTTVGNFIDPIFNITKSAPTTYDLTVTDIDGNVLAVIPNHRTFCHYKVIQLLDTEGTYLNTVNSAVEVLFKRKFNPFVNDYDEFLFGDKYDKAIYWKFKEHQADKVDDAVAYASKCKQVLDNIAQNTIAETKVNIGFTRNPFFGLPYGSKYAQYRYAPIWY